MKSQHLSLAALVLTFLGGGTGVTVNYVSNKEVIKKLEEVTITLVEFKGSIKASDERNARLETQVEKHAIILDRLKDEISSLKQSIKVLESRQK